MKIQVATFRLSTYATVSVLAGLLMPFVSLRAQLVNLSSRIVVTPSQAITGGLVIGGSSSVTVLIRAVGPSLQAFGVANPLKDPSLVVYDSAGKLVAGPISRWDEADAATASAVGAFALQANSSDAATVVTLAPGTYTASVTSAGGNSGTALLEAYQAGPSASARMVNLSFRANVDGADNGSIVTGFVISGTQSRSILIRAVGPGLAPFGVANILGDPVLQVANQQGSVVAQNDNWQSPMQGGASASQLQAAFAQSGAFSLPAGSSDAAVLTTLAPGAYTVSITSADGGSGTALAEVYDVTAENPGSPAPTGGTPSSPEQTPSSPSASAASAYTDAVWFDDTLPAGAQAQSGAGNEGWSWVASGPASFAGAKSHQSLAAAGLHDHGFNYATAAMSVGTGDQLFTYVYLNPSNPPTEIMLSWNDGASGEHRAYWGADSISYGTDNSTGRFPMGALPAAGAWVRLAVPASEVALEGASVVGMGFSTYGGQATYDHSGVAVASSSGSGGSSSSPGSTGATGSSGSTGSTGSPGTGSTGSSSGAVSTAPTGIISASAGSDSANRTADPAAAGDNVDDTALELPAVGDNLLHILSPSILELVSINTKQPDPGQVSSWNFVDSGGKATEPAAGRFAVTVGGQAVAVKSVGFKRRVLYAPLGSYDLRIENCLYLEIASPVGDGQGVVVKDPDGTLWNPATQYTALCDPQRYSPAIHVNQEGYVPSFAKQAMVGYFMGDLGEMPIAAAGGFNIVDADTGVVVYSGGLSLRPDSGFETTPLPYQQVYVADFTAFTTPGQYQLQVPGMGASLPFLIDDGIAMAWTRTYALGMYEQRSGMAVSLPYTRFTHAADHTAPASVPGTGSQFTFTWSCISGYATTANSANPAQTAPLLTSPATSLYPFVNTGTVDVSGGHFDAGDYSKYTINSAQLTHELIFAVDNIPGLQDFDNLGIPESGDGIPDVLQEAKWEADFLAKMQDADGGFYFLVYPANREYESNVLPENGDAQVVWPKTTSVTAAAVAALAEAGSSPTMIKYWGFESTPPASPRPGFVLAPT